eukprot:10201379-Ditylum_brightwellii.AAC.1
MSPHHPDLMTLTANGSHLPCRTLFNFGEYIFFQDMTGNGIFLFPVQVEHAAQVQTSQFYPRGWPVH